MVQYSCCQCVWLNLLLCSQYWQELLKHALGNQTLFCWDPNASSEALHFHILPVTDSLFLQLFLYITTEKLLGFPDPCRIQGTSRFRKYSWFGPCLEWWCLSHTRNIFAFGVEGNFLSLNIYVHSFMAQISLESSSVLSKSSSHLPPTFLSLLATVVKDGMWKLTYSNLGVLSIRVVHPWIQCHQEGTEKAEKSSLGRRRTWQVWSLGHIFFIVGFSAVQKYANFD